MNGHLYICLLAVMLLIGGITYVKFLSNEAKGQGIETAASPVDGPTLNNTDCNVTIGQTSPNLNITIAPRIIIEYGDYAITQSLNPNFPPLQISPRAIIEYADAASQLALQSPQGLNETEVTPGIIIEYADYASFNALPMQSYPGPDIPEAAHDVAVTNVRSSKTVVGKGFSANVSVTVANQGSYTETVNATAYANATVIWSENVTLPAGNSTTVTFTWNTNAYGNYTISAYALLVSGETNTGNNNLIGGAVTVTIPGDVDGNGRVDMNDIVSICKAFGSTPGQPNWNPNCDINGKGKVDMNDIVIAASNFGQHIP